MESEEEEESGLGEGEGGVKARGEEGRAGIEGGARYNQIAPVF